MDASASLMLAQRDQASALQPKVRMAGMKVAFPDLEGRNADNVYSNDDAKTAGSPALSSVRREGMRSSASRRAGSVDASGSGGAESSERAHHKRRQSAFAVLQGSNEAQMNTRKPLEPLPDHMKFDFERFDDPTGLPFELQGDHSMYTEESLRKRQELSRDPDIITMLEKFWNTYKRGDGLVVRSRPFFSRIIHSLCP